MGGSCLSVTLPVQGLRTPHPCQAQVRTEGAGEGSRQLPQVGGLGPPGSSGGGSRRQRGPPLTALMGLPHRPCPGQDNAPCPRRA